MHCIYAKQVAELINRRHSLIHSMPDLSTHHHTLHVSPSHYENMQFFCCAHMFLVRV